MKSHQMNDEEQIAWEIAVIKNPDLLKEYCGLKITSYYFYGSYRYEYILNLHGMWKKHVMNWQFDNGDKFY
jgi:hypothetical protein